MRNLIAIGLILGSVGAAAAQSHSKEDEAACKPDVYRLCAGEIPNRGRIVACLERKRGQLNPACSQVFERNAAARAAVRNEGPSGR